jgi:hypothetical protein
LEEILVEQNTTRQLSMFRLKQPPFHQKHFAQLSLKTVLKHQVSNDFVLEIKNKSRNRAVLFCPLWFFRNDRLFRFVKKTTP